MTPDHPDSVLRHRPFVLFWFARLAVTVGYQMLIVAVGWQLYALTGNPFDLGLVGLIQFIPAMLLFLVVGQVTDRYDRRCHPARLPDHRGGRGRDAVHRRPHRRDLARADPRRRLHPRRRARLRGDRDADHGAEPGAAAAGAARGRGFGQRESESRPSPARRSAAFSTRPGPSVVYGACLALFAGGAAHAADPARARSHRVARADDARDILCRLRVHPPQPAILGVISLDLFAVLLGGVTALLPVFARDVFEAGPWALGLLRAAPGGRRARRRRSC